MNDEEFTVPFDAVPFNYTVPSDPMDEFQCDSCQ